jgi:uncharacterized protein YkwD
MIAKRRTLWVTGALLAGLAGGCGGSDISGGAPSCQSTAGTPCVCAAGSSTQCSAASEPLPSPVSGMGGSLRPTDPPDAGRPMPVPMPPPVSRLPDPGAMSAGAGGGAPSGPVAGSLAIGGSGGRGAAIGGSGGSGAAQPTGDEVPTGAHCAGVATWDPEWVAFEEDVLRLTNETRARGADCGEEGRFAATTPLTMNPMLRCSSRLHSQDMGEREYFDHTNLDGVDPFDRMMEAGYRGNAMGENIAMGQQSPEEVVEGWEESDGHCANMLSPMFTELGVGYWEGESDNRFFNGNKLWTQNFGRPQSQRGGQR